MTTLGKSKAVHPNRLVVQHDIFLANKNLVTKMRTVKSSIPQVNKDYEKKLETRKKRDHTKNYTSVPTLDNETFQAILQQRISNLTNPTCDFVDEIYENEQSEQPLIFADQEYSNMRRSYDKPNTNTVYNAYLTNQYKLPKTASTREMTSARSNSLLNRAASPKNTTTTRVITGPSDNHVQTSPYKEYFKEDVGSLKTHLVDKKKEMEVFKQELKDWWHDDLKGLTMQPTKSQSDKKPTFGDTKPIFGRKMSDDKPDLFSYNKENNKTRKLSGGISKVQISTTTGEKQFRINNHKSSKKENPPNSYVKKKTSENRTLKEGNNKIQSHEMEDECLRPSTVTLPKRIGNEKFKLRFSSHLDSLPNRQNTRYDISPQHNDQEGYFASPNQYSDYYSNENSQPASKTNLDQLETNQFRVEEEEDEEESPQPVLNSKAIMHQIPTQKSHVIRYHSIPEDEFETTWKHQELPSNGQPMSESELVYQSRSQLHENNNHGTHHNAFEDNDLRVSVTSTLNPMDKLNNNSELF